MINNGAMITLNALSSANLRMFWGVGEENLAEPDNKKIKFFDFFEKIP